MPGAGAPGPGQWPPSGRRVRVAKPVIDRHSRPAGPGHPHCTKGAHRRHLRAAHLSGPPAPGLGPLPDHRDDAKIMQIYEGTNQFQRVIMARELLGG